jgi:hypothetical protein
VEFSLLHPATPSWASWKEEEEEGGLARPCMAHLGINPQLQSVATDFILHRFSATGPWSPHHHDTDLRFHSTSFLVVSVSVSGLGEPCVATSHLHPSRLALFTQLALHTAIFTRLA